MVREQRNAGACHLSSPRVTPGLKHSTLRSSPKAIGRAALNLRFTWAYSSQMAQPDDHPPAGGLLHHLLTLTLTTPLKEQDSKSGYFLLPTPTVTNSFYFRKWDALCCPDFPLSSPSGNASDKPEHCFRTAKVTKKFDLTTNFAKFLNSFRFSLPSQCHFQDIREGFLTTFLLTFFIFVYNLQTFSFIYRSRKIQKSSKQL